MAAVGGIRKAGCEFDTDSGGNGRVGGGEGAGVGGRWDGNGGSGLGGHKAHE